MNLVLVSKHNWRELCYNFTIFCYSKLELWFVLCDWADLLECQELTKNLMNCSLTVNLYWFGSRS